MDGRLYDTRNLSANVAQTELDLNSSSFCLHNELKTQTDKVVNAAQCLLRDVLHRRV